jgi:hypothetical protein
MTDLAKVCFLGRGRLEEVLFLIVLGQSLIGEPIRLVVALPPFHLVKLLRLSPFHVTLDLVDVVHDLVGYLPKPRELVAVGGPGLIGSLEALYQGLAVYD